MVNCSMYSELYMSPQDLEIAADFSVQVPPAELLSVLQSSDHVQVSPPTTCR